MESRIVVFEGDRHRWVDTVPASNPRQYEPDAILITKTNKVKAVRITEIEVQPGGYLND
jgi:hypothetical protein